MYRLMLTWFVFLSIAIGSQEPSITKIEKIAVQTEADFLNLMQLHLPDVLKECSAIKGQFSQVKTLADSGGSFINSVI